MALPVLPAVALAADTPKSLTDEQLAALTETLTRHMVALESLAPEDRSTRLQEIRALIAAALDLPDALTYPAPREGRA